MLIAMILLWAIFRVWNNKEGSLYSYIKAIIVWTFILYIGTEGLSLFTALSVLSARLYWGIADIILMGILILLNRKYEKKISFPKINRIPSFPIIVCILSGIILCVISFYIAILIAPYNWDSLTYHLPRIMHWVQNGTVAHYATNMSRQVSSPVLAEFVELFVYLICGKSDILFNLLQWTSYVTCAVFTAGVARKLKCTTFWTCMAGVLFLTMPIAFAEAFTTQNDLYNAMWLLMFVYVLLDLYDSPKLTFNKYYIERTLILSCCIGFGYLSKPSIMFAILFFAVGLLILCIKYKAFLADTVKLVCCAIVTVLMIVLPEILRVVFTFEAFSDPMVGNRQLIGTLKPSYMFVNYLKNITFNAANAYVKTDDLVLSILYFFSNRLNVVLDDPSISEDGRNFFLVEARTYHHNSAVSPVIFWGVIAAIMIAVIFYKKIKLSEVHTLYCILAVVSFNVFCAFLRWEPFVSRYMISYLALLCPVIVLILGQASKSIDLKHYAYSITGILLFVGLVESVGMVNFHIKAADYAKQNERGQEYFYITGEGNYGDYLDIVEDIKENNFTNIGLLTGYDSFEYPLWQYLPKEGYHLQHVGVNNKTVKHEDPEFIPDCIFVRDVSIEYLDYHGVRYSKKNPDSTIGTYLLIPTNNY